MITELNETIMRGKPRFPPVYPRIKPNKATVGKNGKK